MQMATSLKTYDTLSEVKGGTILDQTKKTFNIWAAKGWAGSPVEFCYNSVRDKFDPKTEKVTKESVFASTQYYCMRPFNSNYLNPTDALLFRVTNKSGRPTTLANFYNYMFNPKSPWHSAFKGLCFIGRDKYDIPDYILWHDTAAADCKVTANLFSALRLHTCWGLDAVWQKLVDADFDEETALLLCSNFSFAGQTITVSNGPKGLFEENVLKNLNLSKFGCSKTDMPFSTNYNPSGFAPFLVDKTPSTISKSLMEKTPIQPNNFIWHADKKPVNADSLSKSSPEYLNSKLKIVTGKDPTGLVAYLTGAVKTFSTATRLELTEKLAKNELVEL